MTAKEFFTVILKVMGIYMIKDVLIAIPAVIQAVLQFFSYDAEGLLFTFLIAILVFGINGLIVYVLLFKTEFMIEKLKLISGFSEKPLTTGLHRSTVYTIAILISGILILVFSVPNMLRQVYYWLDYIRQSNEFYLGQPFDYANLIIAITEVIIGSLFIAKQRPLINFIERKRRDATE